ncbi:cellulase family glycosylhydrolase [Archangium minus]|uniref:mannan endo-1,4-beta-mannosidase n=1 Tax=Archangium minus TaxID=83450 RepID=A0ABY9X5Z0_9BACT|nr:cellulase family glycosylhydrolase [Archangium minus]
MSPRPFLRLVPIALLTLVACAAPRTLSAPSQGALPEVERLARFEVGFELPERTRHPDDVSIEARFTAPSGEVVTVGGFAVVGGGFRVRFTPQETGEYRYVIRADGGSGLREVSSGGFRVRRSDRRGFVRRGAGSAHQLAWEDGKPFLPLGENRFNLYDPTWNYNQLSAPEYVAYMASHGMNTLRIFIFTDCEREEPQPGPQPGCLEPQVGRFDPEVAAQYDAILEAAEKHGLYVILTLFAVGFTPGETWKSWEDNPYSTERGGPAETPIDFFERPDIRVLAERKLRYVLDRYGYSPHLLAVDLLNEPEWDGNNGEEFWIPWGEHMAEVWHAADPYGHLVTLGSVGLHWNESEGDERPWYASPHNDVLQWHLYGKEYYQVHALAAEFTRKVAESWGYGKPVLCGEFGYGLDDPQTFDHTHVGIWSATFSGAGVLAHSAPPFTADSDVLMTPKRGRHFRVLSDFLSRLSLSPPLHPQLAPLATPEGTRAWVLGRSGYWALWILGAEKGYGSPVRDATVRMGAPSGKYRVTWWNDVTGEQLATEELTAQQEGLVLRLPGFVRHVAGVVEALPAVP